MHGSAHSHDHGHSHAPADFGRAFAVGIALNTGFVAIETAAGILSGSMALVADAGHNLSDVLSLALAWGAHVATARAPGGRYTYGFKSSSILAALANAALLMIAVGAILVETGRRLFVGIPATDPGIVMVVAAIGIAINALTAWLFVTERKGDLNIRGAYLHMAADAAVSAGVVLAGLAIWLTGWHWIDPAVSLAIVAVIAWSGWGLLRESLRMGLLAVPDGIDQQAVRRWLAARPGVAAVHDLHIWPMSTTETALTVHLVMPGGGPGDGFLAELAQGLAHEFGIAHPTVQVETGTDRSCALDDSGCG